ncbi:SMPD1 [Cordylochernes scorpioides]|uniref:Sphingomyelin phosphodiesterase n=1 Tax=Cordylochernes scorpioides TaxID=51811 RepID=A0ABY6JZ01_9ARAC|nr:SMPD1 [Cordylochernes scorpioides]
MVPSLLPVLLLALSTAVLARPSTNLVLDLEDADNDIGMFYSAFDIYDSQQLVSEFRNGHVSSKTCMLCRVGVQLFQRLVQSDKSEDEIAKEAGNLCTTFNVATPRVCHGTVQLFKSEIVQVLSRVVLTPDEICGLVLGPVCGEVRNPFEGWNVTMSPFPKPPVTPPTPPKPNAPVLKVLHLSDTHFDPYYKEGNDADCGEPLCCRIQDGPAPTPERAAGKWGDYRDCDTPLRTLEHMLQNIARNHKIDYVLWTGDIPPHDIWNTTRKSNIEILHSVSRMINKYLGKVPIFPALGNHESSPVNSFPIPEIVGKNSISWLYEELALAWKPWLPEQSLRTLRKGAYYSVTLQSNFKIISINTNYCNNLNWWLLINTTDPANQLRWLINELQLSELIGQKVHIIGHIPPGTMDCLSEWSRNFYKIINRYEGTVTAQFYGHTHTDEFEVFYDEETLTRPTSIAYVGPSVTTYEGVNPGYRIYTVDGNYKDSSKFTNIMIGKIVKFYWYQLVLDHETYTMDLEEANRNDKPVWELEYTAKADLGMPSLTPKDWNDLISRMAKDDDLFQKFYRYWWWNK